MTKSNAKKVTSRKAVEKAPLTSAERKALYIKALAKKFGEGSVVTRTQLREMAESDERFPHFAAVRKDQDYRVGHGQYVVTTSDNPAKVRDQVVKRLEKEAAQAEKALLPKETRSSAAKLAAAVKSANTNKKAAKVKSKAKKAA